MNYARFITAFSARRHYLPLRKLAEIQTTAGPSLIALGTGAPNPNCFPFEEIIVKTKDKRQFALQGPLLNVALSYGASPGMLELINWLKELQIKIHKPPIANRREGDDGRMELIIVPGSQDGLSKCLEMLVQPGDYVLMEEPAYPGSIAVLRPYAPKYFTMETDEFGLRPDSIRKLLSRWTSDDARKQDVRMPKILVVQPNHCNPTGVSLTLERRLEIYKIAQEYNLIIIEDDPYHFLTFGGKTPPPSFLSLDTDGRVLKLDSFSKVMSAGIRMGTLTGPKTLVDRVLMHVASSSVQCSTLSQVIILQLLQQWGHDGFLEHTKGVAKFYESQCKMMLNAAETHLKGLADWNVPTGGMFLWLKVRGVRDTCKMIMEKALSKQVVLAPGSYFTLDDKLTSHLRASYSAVDEEQMNEAFRRLAGLIREEQNASGG